MRCLSFKSAVTRVTGCRLKRGTVSTTARDAVMTHWTELDNLHLAHVVFDTRTKSEWLLGIVEHSTMVGWTAAQNLTPNSAIGALFLHCAAQLLLRHRGGNTQQVTHKALALN